jgi:RNA polymerase sigma-70 factor (ECF subfamily)
MTLETPAHELIEKAQAGDRQAFDLLVRRHQGRLEALIRSRMSRHRLSENDRGDVLQEVLLRSFEVIDRFRWQGEDSFMRWLGAIVENVILNAVKKLSRREVLRLDRSVAGTSEPPSRTMRRHERFDRLEACLGRLSEDHRTVIVLARIEGLPTREIARRMNRSESAVKNLLLRAIKALRQSFGDTESLGLPDRELRAKGKSDGF